MQTIQMIKWNGDDSEDDAAAMAECDIDAARRKKQREAANEKSGRDLQEECVVNPKIHAASSRRLMGAYEFVYSPNHVTAGNDR
jgi:hypothetical protein